MRGYRQTFGADLSVEIPREILDLENKRRHEMKRPNEESEDEMCAESFPPRS